MPPGMDERIKLDKSITELFSIRAAVEPPNAPLPDTELRRRLYDVQWAHGLIDPDTPRPGEAKR